MTDVRQRPRGWLLTSFFYSSSSERWQNINPRCSSDGFIVFQVVSYYSPRRCFSLLRYLLKKRELKRWELQQHLNPTIIICKGWSGEPLEKIQPTDRRFATMKWCIILMLAKIRMSSWHKFISSNSIISSFSAHVLFSHRSCSNQNSVFSCGLDLHSRIYNPPF